MGVVTLRLTDNVHKALKVLAHQKMDSVNKVCTALIVEAIEKNEAAKAAMETKNETTGVS